MNSCTNTLRIPPLWRFFVHARANRSQAVIFLLYVLYVAFISFVSIQRHMPVETRLAGFPETLCLFLPFVLTDSYFKLNGPMRVFAAPRASLVGPFLAYIASRLCLAVGIGTLALLVLVNLDLPKASVGESLAVALLLSLAFASLCTFLGLVVQQPLLASVLTLAVFFTTWTTCLKVEALYPILRSFVFPVHILDAQVQTPWPLLVLQVLACVIFWNGLAYVVFRRAFR